MVGIEAINNKFRRCIPDLNMKITYANMYFSLRMLPSKLLDLLHMQIIQVYGRTIAQQAILNTVLFVKRRIMNHMRHTMIRLIINAQDAEEQVTLPYRLTKMVYLHVL